MVCFLATDGVVSEPFLMPIGEVVKTNCTFIFSTPASISCLITKSAASISSSFAGSSNVILKRSTVSSHSLHLG